MDSMFPSKDASDTEWVPARGSAYRSIDWAKQVYRCDTSYANDW